MGIYADLHSHSDFSDGAFTPAEVMQQAAAAGISVMCLSDHDSVRGLDEAEDAAHAAGIRMCPGVEISAGDEADKERFDLHILGLFIDRTSPALNEFLDYQADQRRGQKAGQIRRLQELGFRIDEEDVFEGLRGSPGKPHIVAALLRRNPEMNLVEDDLYRDYLTSGGKAHVDRADEPTAEDCIEAIHAAGGVAMVAHPLYYQRKTQDLFGMIRGLVDAGLDGVEVDCPYELTNAFGVGRDRADLVREIDAFTTSLGLLRSGGSDFHGMGKGGPIGSAGMDKAGFEALQASGA